MAFGPVNVPGSSSVDISGLVPETRTVNKKPLTEDISLTAEDVGAAAKEHGHTGYLPKINPKYSGSLVGEHISVGVHKTTPGNVIGSGCYSVGGLVTGYRSFCVGRYAGRITNVVAGSDNKTATVTVTDDGGYLWRMFDSTLVLPVDAAVLHHDGVKNTQSYANVRVTAFDETAKTMTLSINPSFLEKILADNDTKKLYQ